MEKQHEINSMGVVYVILLLGNIVIYTLSLILPNMGIQLPSTMCTVLCEIAILLPTIIYIKSKGDNISKRLGFHKIKNTTVLLTVLLTLVTTPIYIFTNLFSQLFVKNTVVQNSSDMLGGPAILALIVASVMAPICEEIAFRGFLVDRLKGIFPIITDAVVSALLFGIMHLNFNQFCYAFVLGVIFALANHASGSTWTSVIMHSLFNFVNVSIFLAMQLSLEAQNIDIVQEQEAVRSQTGIMLYSVILYGFISVICVFLVWLLLKAIANNQGNLEAFKSSFARKDNLDAATDAGVRVHSLLNVPMVFSVLIGIAAMIVYQVTVL